MVEKLKVNDVVVFLKNMFSSEGDIGLVVGTGKEYGREGWVRIYIGGRIFECFSGYYNLVEKIGEL